ncbi:sensor histidine kinase [Anaerosporobacter sp.]|uniref:sensor histidine kinase n=1 Tax=Anaerosporobacter sp. TaxID=1872529 RepID=UPI00286F1FEC|nr:HAMP domain-containing sensor histidine kinase [Anaerosporobacter sp.]
MKFSYKILLCTVIIMAAAFGFSGYFFVNYVFETALDREINQAMDDSNILQFAFETAALNVPSKYNILQDTVVEQIGSKLESSGQDTGRLLRLSGEERKVLYVSDGFVEDGLLIQSIEPDTHNYRIIQQQEHYYIQTGIQVNALNRVLYLETMKDVTVVFEERMLGFSVYRQVTLLMLLCSSVVMLFLSSWLTRPIRLLAEATGKMAKGDYGYRAKRISNDELGSLTMDYNRMANALEENIDQLKEEVQSKEDFIAAFAHELKTPLTAIIGYADLLRSRKLDDERNFLSANYIYTEGKRLEAMSFRLLDIIVTKRESIKPQKIEAEILFEYLEYIFSENTEMKFAFSYETGKIYAEVDLLKSVLLNLIDNACKASESGSMIEVKGTLVENGYQFEVKDSGLGIPKEDLKKVTQAFYMVDKSRSRSRKGAGLGLALCAEILYLHHSELEIESVEGQGTCIRFILPKEEVCCEKE